MFKILLCIFFLSGCMSQGTSTHKDKENLDWAYLDGGNSSVGVILCHGRGGDPDWYVVGALRKRINKKLGYHTLSMQMPGGEKSRHEYYSDFAATYQAIQTSVDYLRNKKGVKKVYIIGHSLGARMASAYLSKYPMADISGFVGVGMLNNGGNPFDCSENLANVSIPILDIYPKLGKYDDAMHARSRKKLISANYQQKMISGANHAFSSSSSEEKLSVVVISWLESQNK